MSINIETLTNLYNYAMSLEANSPKEAYSKYMEILSLIGQAKLKAQSDLINNCIFRKTLMQGKASSQSDLKRFTIKISRLKSDSDPYTIAKLCQYYTIVISYLYYNHLLNAAENKQYLAEACDLLKKADCNNMSVQHLQKLLNELTKDSNI